MKRLILILLPFIFIFNSRAQQFENINAGLSSLKESAVAWGDFDNDGDADIIACGHRSNDTPLTVIFQNDEGVFNEIDPGITDVADGSVAWGDYDMDGDLDLLITGLADTVPFSAIYNNDNGVFTDANASLIDLMGGDGAWGDYDNDGDLDVFITGSFNSKLYENQDGNFIETSFVFPDMQGSSIAFGDYDNDGDLDIFLMGDTGAGIFSYIFENTDGDFIQTSHIFEGLFAGTACWVDYDNDGDLDLNFSGLDMYIESNYNIYVNNGDGTFTSVYTPVPQISSSTSEWGDIDNDGDLDLYVAGKLNSCGSYYAGMYKNDDGNLQNHSGATLTDSYDGSAGWADYDNDGDMDLIVTGQSGSGSLFTRIYRNMDNSNAFAYNTDPIAPDNLQTNVTDNVVEFSWDKGSDNETSQDGLSYNIRIGFSPGTQEIASSMSDENGMRLIYEIGNVGQSIDWTIKNFGLGTYYWSVQTIDQCGSGSTFSATESFIVLHTGFGEEQDSDKDLTILQNPVYNNLEFIYGENYQDLVVRIINSSGQVLIQENHSGGKHSINIEDLSSGIYVLQLETGDRVVSKKFLVKR